MLYRLRDLDEAERACRTALHLHPECAQAYFWLGTIFEARKEWDSAVDADRKVYELDPSHMSGHVHAVDSS